MGWAKRKVKTRFPIPPGCGTKITLPPPVRTGWENFKSVPPNPLRPLGEYENGKRYRPKEWNPKMMGKEREVYQKVKYPNPSDQTSKPKWKGSLWGTKDYYKILIWLKVMEVPGNLKVKWNELTLTIPFVRINPNNFPKNGVNGRITGLQKPKRKNEGPIPNKWIINPEWMVRSEPVTNLRMDNNYFP